MPGELDDQLEVAALSIRSFHVGIKGLIVRDGRFLLLRNGSFEDLPGGRIDDRENPIETLRRELAEELPGIRDVQVGPLLGCDRVADLREDLSLFIVVYEVAAELPDPIALSPEHDHAEWAPLELAKERLAQMPIEWDRVS